VHDILRQAQFDYDRHQYNTVVSAGMKMLNTLETLQVDSPAALAVINEGLSILLRVLYPVVPHITCYLWQALGYTQHFGPLLDAPWPQVDETALVRSTLCIVVQVNGKLRGQIEVPADANKASIEQTALADDSVQRHLEGKPIKKVIVVPGKLINLVV
jgi:leucyl-tRNA synthetase